MPFALFMNHNVERAVVDGLRLRGIDVLTAFEDQAHLLSDPELLDRATTLDRILFTHDEDLVIEARRRQAAGIAFPGVVYARQTGVTVGRCIADLELIAKAGHADEMRNTLLFLPLP